MLVSIKRGNTIWECDWCKKHFKTLTGRATEAIKNGHNKFCSRECKSNYDKKYSANRLHKWIKNNGNPKFKGGIGITTDGYIWIRIIGKFHNKIKLHRYLMEVKIGRKLKHSEIVHHINGDKFDNRIENLELTTISDHNKKHRNFCRENRNDLWSDDELALLNIISAKEFSDRFPQRTVASVYQKKHRLKEGR